MRSTPSRFRHSSTILAPACFTIVFLHGGPEMAPIPPTARPAPAQPGRPSSIAASRAASSMGAPRSPPYPPPLGTPRHSRVAPRRSLLHARPPPWGPRDRPHTPHRSARPATPGPPPVARSSTRAPLHGRPDLAPLPAAPRPAPPRAAPP